VKCNQVREIAGHGLCFKCYRAAERKVADVLWSRPDPTAKELLKQQRKTRKGLLKMMDSIEEISPGKLVPEATLEAWRLLLQPEILRIAQSLGPRTGMDVNSAEEDLSELITELAELRDANSADENVSGPFTEQAGQVHRPIRSDQFPPEPPATVHQPEDQSPVVTESAHETSEQVNGHQQNVSEQFTERTGTSEEKGRGEPPAETSETGQTSTLPPGSATVPTKMRRPRQKSHAA
jgi:hypothetical protein